MHRVSHANEPRRFDASQAPRIVGPIDGLAIDLSAVGVRFMVWAEESGGRFSLVELPSCR